MKTAENMLKIKPKKEKSLMLLLLILQILIKEIGMYKKNK